jgi:hypothetical protein
MAECSRRGLTWQSVRGAEARRYSGSSCRNRGAFDILLVSQTTSVIWQLFLVEDMAGGRAARMIEADSSLVWPRRLAFVLEGQS